MMLFKSFLICLASSVMIQIIASVEHFGQRLPGNVFTSLNTIGKRMCSNECDKFPLCQSVNYNRELLLCELNKEANIAALESSTDYVFIRKNGVESSENTTRCNVSEVQVSLKSREQTCVLELLECGNFILGTIGGTGSIRSPGYEVGSYEYKSECIWTLANTNTVDSSFYLSYIRFLVNTDPNCLHHFLEIREGNDENGNKIGKYCGNTTQPRQLLSPIPNLYIRWMTDLDTMKLGFSLYYRITDCGGDLTQNNSIITSPRFPYHYPNYAACAWQINAPEGYQIKLVFEVFQIEYHNSCNYDYIDILDGPLPTSPPVGPFCGYNMSFFYPFVSISNSIRVIFKTDSSVTDVGFKARYTF